MPLQKQVAPINLNVFPTFAVNNMTQGTFWNIIFFCDLSLFYSTIKKFSNLQNKFFSIFGSTSSFAKSVSTFIKHIFIVICYSAKKQMRWFNAIWNIAFMAYTHSIGNGAIVDFPRNTMNQCCSKSPTNLYLPVAFWFNISSPKPTGFSFFNFGKESINQRFGFVLVNTAWHNEVLI